MKVYLYFKSALSICLFIFLIATCAQTGHQHSASSAYRPNSEYAELFANSLKTSTVAIYPTIVRTTKGTRYSEISQRQIVSLLNDNEITSAAAKSRNIDPGPLKNPPQWEIFVHDMNSVAANIQGKESNEDYSLVMEVILSPENQSVWGIHCFIYDRQGNNVFSFLLNSHHRLFSNAKLSAQDTSETARTELINKATEVGVDALVQLVESARKLDQPHEQGYTISSQKIATLGKRVDKVFIFARIHERLVQVVMHSLKHSLESGFESNDVENIVKVMPRDSNDYAKFSNDVKSLSPEVMMYIDLDPLLRTRKDGYEAIVGTIFNVSVFNHTSEELIWQAEGKVDYIKMFGSRYTAHQGIRKELAWHTTAAIVRTFILDMNGHKSAPIYTVTEDRQVNGQRID